MFKNPSKCLWRLEPDNRSNFFFSPPVHLCAVTYVTEISLHVTLSNLSHSLTHIYSQVSVVLLIVFTVSEQKSKCTDCTCFEKCTGSLGDS